MSDAGHARTDLVQGPPRWHLAALRGEVDAANAAWDKLFDIVTALRISELNARRKGAGEAERAEKLTNYRRPRGQPANPAVGAHGRSSLKET